MNTYNQEQAIKSARYADRFAKIRPGRGIIDEAEKALGLNGESNNVSIEEVESLTIDPPTTAFDEM